MLLVVFLIPMEVMNFMFRGAGLLAFEDEVMQLMKDKDLCSSTM